MSQSLPPLGWFRAFESAAVHQSFTAAAEELGLTQSAVSQNIRALESRLGCRLFVRKPRGIALTDDGRKLLPDVRRAIDTLRTATAPFVQQQSELLTVATSVSVAQWYLAPLLPQYLAANPDIDIRLMTTVWPDTLADTTDVQIRFGAADTQTALGDNKLVLVAAPALIKNNPLPLSADVFKQHPLIQAVGTSDSWAACGQQFSIDAEPASLIYVDSHGLAVDMARYGSGIALTSELIATPLLATGELLLVNPKTPGAQDGYFISTLSGNKSGKAQQFVDWLLREVKQINLNAAAT